MIKLSNEDKAKLSQALGPDFLGTQELSLVHAFETFYTILKNEELSKVEKEVTKTKAAK